MEAVRGRLLYQGAPIESEGRANIENALRGRRNMSAENVGVMMNIWDGMARVSAEQGLIERPEDFYKEWLGGVRLARWEEFNTARAIIAEIRPESIAEFATRSKPLRGASATPTGRGPTANRRRIAPETSTSGARSWCPERSTRTPTHFNVLCGARLR